MKNIIKNCISTIYSKFSSILPETKKEIFLTIRNTNPAPIFFDEEKIIKDINELIKDKKIGPLSIRHKVSDWKLIISVNGKKQYLYNDELRDNTNSYLTSQHYDHFDGLYDKETQDIICFLQYSIPNDIKKNDVLNSDLIRISSTIKWLWINIQQLFYDAAAWYGFKYVVWYQVSSYLSKYFLAHGNRIRLISLPENIQSYLCDTYEMRNKCTVVLLDKITTQENI